MRYNHPRKPYTPEQLRAYGVHPEAIQEQIDKYRHRAAGLEGAIVMTMSQQLAAIWEYVLKGDLSGATNDQE